MHVFQIDAFTDKPFGGNPAAVCMLSKAQDPAWMQSFAQEMNLSETAFFHPYKDGYNLRWFTPQVEVELCGHATLASAHVLWEMNYLSPNETARFYTKSGLLTARKKERWIELDFPAELPQACEVPAELLKALDVKPVYTGKNRFDYLLEIESEEELRKLTPDFTELAKVQTRGVIVTCKSIASEFDFISRFFAPATGINEDPVTGSAHCCLAPYWGSKLGKDRMVGYQASARGGLVKVRTNFDRVLLSGQAIIVLKGEWLG
jgi:PhzF family phenazine biosynthesis protein